MFAKTTYWGGSLCNQYLSSNKGIRVLSLILPWILLWLCHKTQAEDISPPHVYQRLQHLSQEVELLRQELGSAKLLGNIYQVSGAAPRQVLYQAKTLCEKSRQLRFEWLRGSGRCPELKLGDIKPSDVLQHVDSALLQVSEVRHFIQNLSIKKQHEPYANIPYASEIASNEPGSLQILQQSKLLEPKDINKTPSDVFMAIVELNRQLNLMLRDKQVADDVYRQVSLGIYYGAEILKSFPKLSQRIPTLPSFKARKTAKDVYLILIDSFSLLHQVYTLSKQPSLTIKINRQALDSVSPNDVYDIAALIVSDLAHLYWLLGGKNLIKAYQPPPKIASQVYQRSQLLEKQLKLLLEQVLQQPNWLASSL